MLLILKLKSTSVVRYRNERKYITFVLDWSIIFGPLGFCMRYVNSYTLKFIEKLYYIKKPIIVNLSLSEKYNYL